MSTFFDEMKRSFVDVPVEDGKIATSEFLEAAEALVKLFDLLGSSAFAVVQNDMTGNINKVRAKLLAAPDKAGILQDLILSEVNDKKKTATQGLLWLCRGLQFTAVAMRETVSRPNDELSKTFTDAYGKTLTKYHTMLIRPVFKLAMKACPYRADFFAKLGADQEKVAQQLEEWLSALENIVNLIMDFFEKGNYGKGFNARSKADITPKTETVLRAAPAWEEEEAPEEVDSSLEPEDVAEEEPVEVLEWLMEDEDSVAAEQTNLSPWIPPFFSRELNSSQSALPVVSKSKPPLTVDSFGKVALSNSPLRMTAPPMVCRLSKPSMVSKFELLAMTNPPPTDCKSERSISDKSSLSMIERSPPIFFRVGISRDSTLDSKTPSEELTVLMLDIEIDETEQSVGDRLDIRVDGSQVLVVVDVEGLDVDWVETLQRLQLSVRDVDALTVRNTCRQTCLGQCRQGDPVDGANRDQGTERQSVQDIQVGQLQLLGDGSQGVCSQRLQVGAVENRQRAVNGLDVGDGSSSQITGDVDVTLNGRTGGQVVQVGLSGGGQGLGERAS
ncbi:hypothetical protein OGATHE_006552 [Ogataea polymorpha]|uniref:Glycolipid transfer protein domain-containing protein n=1 Tax=Ogataea polymorpha TaxID=460523 RepID=A0A9P8NTA8_9ASCO|nr:hypothetical protein OGATHE_006552 [Ogataea polymorpha]